MQDGSKKECTSRYLTAVQAATNTVSSWLQKDEDLLDSGVPSNVAAAAEQLHDERPIRKTNEVTLVHDSFPVSCSLPAKSPVLHRRGSITCESL